MHRESNRESIFEMDPPCALLRPPLARQRQPEEEVGWLDLCRDDFDVVPHESPDA